jgi:hypothetical protein
MTVLWFALAGYPPLAEFSRLHRTLPDLARTNSTANPWALPTVNLISSGTRTLQNNSSVQQSFYDRECQRESGVAQWHPRQVALSTESGTRPGPDT